MGTRYHPNLTLEPSAGTIFADADKAMSDRETALGLGDKRSVTVPAFGQRDYTDGSSIVYNSKRRAAFHIQGAIAEKWRALGALSWGMPISDEEALGDGRGRRTAFEGGKEIVWTPTTGAQAIYGAIRERWNQLGRHHSYLGYPTCDESPFSEGGRINTFEHGDIFWWPDTGALDLSAVSFRLSGVKCYGETDWDQMSSADEPYVIATVMLPDGSVKDTRTQVFERVDGGESRSSWIEVYSGKPTGFTLFTTVMEHDEGNPDIYKEKIHAAAMAIHSVGAAALTLIPVVGWAIAPILAPIGEMGMSALAGAVNDAMDMDDDRIGAHQHLMLPKELIVASCQRADNRSAGLLSNWETPVISGLGASYRVFYDVQPLRG